MKGRFFLGVADNNRFAQAVVGDFSGRIIATSVSGSINHRIWGVEHARDNLGEIIAKTVGWEHRHYLQGVCFTYKSNLSSHQTELQGVAADLEEQIKVQVVDFASSSARGIRSKGDRLLLVGGSSAWVFFKGEGGIRRKIRLNERTWDFKLRISKKLAGSVLLEANTELWALLRPGSHCLLAMAYQLDYLVEQGNPLALELAYDIAQDLVRSVTQLARYFDGATPVIGLYGPIVLGSRTVAGRIRHLLGLVFPGVQVMDTPLAPAKGAYLSSVLTRRSATEDEVISYSSSVCGKRQKGWICVGNYLASDGTNSY